MKAKMIYKVKSWPAYFQAIVDGRKLHDVRDMGERDYRVGDRLVLQEYDPFKGQYTGREQEVEITYITDRATPCAFSSAVLNRDYAILSLKLVRPSYQDRVQNWAVRCFGPTSSSDVQERAHRFLEEALELVQALGCTQDEAEMLVDYVFGRPVGEPAQEVGGVMVTMAALCAANGLDMVQAGETELTRIEGKVEAIRAKHRSKPLASPLPGDYPDVR